MRNRQRRAPYVGLWIFALAFGWIEAAAVVYLREIYFSGVDVVPGFLFPLISLPTHLFSVEIIREACTLLVLGAVACLAGRRPADRMGAFLLTFGVWDLAYYGVLRLVRGWPDSFTTWDLLFLIPLPWVAPVWAPATVAGIFVAAGTYLFWTADRPRQYTRKDVAILLTSALVVIAAFLVEWQVVLNREMAPRFPLLLFWTGVVLGTSWFVRIERRVAVIECATPARIALRTHPALPKAAASPVPTAPQIQGRAGADEILEANPDRIAAYYVGAKRRLAALVGEADEVGERLESLGHGLSTHPMRIIIGRPDRFVERGSECDIVPDHELPPIERLASLTHDIREAAQHVDDLRERLILLGRKDLVAQPDRFFK